MKEENRAQDQVVGELAAMRQRVDELETLQKVYTRLNRLDAQMLQQACARARQQTVPEIVFLLQQQHDERKS